MARWEWRKRLAQRPKTDLGVEACNTAGGRTLPPRPGDRVSQYVVDASVAVEYLLRTPLGLSVADMFEGTSLVAPS